MFAKRVCSSVPEKKSSGKQNYIENPITLFMIRKIFNKYFCYAQNEFFKFCSEILPTNVLPTPFQGANSNAVFQPTLELFQRMITNYFSVFLIIGIFIFYVLLVYCIFQAEKILEMCWKSDRDEIIININKY